LARSRAITNERQLAVRFGQRRGRLQRQGTSLFELVLRYSRTRFGQSLGACKLDLDDLGDFNRCGTLLGECG